MRGILPSLYQIKKTLMYPRKLYMRRRENLEQGFLRSAMELHYYRPAFYKWLEAVSNNPQLLHEADINSHSTVLDVGAYTGEWAQEIAARYHARIIAFEPDPRNFRQLLKTTATTPPLEPKSYGLGEKDEILSMALKYLGSNIYESESDSQAERAEVKIRDVQSVWSELELGQVDLVKINIEGAEFPLLERMEETGLLGSADCYLIQFHEWHPGAYGRRRKIRRALRKTHDLVWEYHFIWEKWVRRS